MSTRVRAAPPLKPMIRDDDDTPSSFPTIWTFIAFDCASFGLFFTVFMWERKQQAALFDASSRQLAVPLGLINTLLLVTSSFLVAMAVAALRRGDVVAARRQLLRGIVVGAGFAAIKIVEYTSKIWDGVTPQTNDFFAYYFGLTGVHFIHYLAGMIVLMVLWGRVRRATTADASVVRWMTSGALFWHMVDLLWVFLFPMLYLLGRVK